MARLRIPVRDFAEHALMSAWTSSGVSTSAGQSLRSADADGEVIGASKTFELCFCMEAQLYQAESGVRKTSGAKAQLFLAG